MYSGHKEFIGKLAHSNTHLLTLYLNVPDLGIKPIRTLVSGCTQLRKFIYHCKSGNTRTDQYLCQLLDALAKLTNLEDLQFDLHGEVSEEPLKHMNRFRELRCLNMVRPLIHFSDRALLEFASYCPKLTKLYLNGGADISFAAFQELLKRCPSLEECYFTEATKLHTFMHLHNKKASQ